MFSRTVVSMMSRNRKFLMILGSIWLLDGLMQFKPLMFTQNFVTSVIWPNTWYQPMDIAYPIYLAGRIILGNVAVFDIMLTTVFENILVPPLKKKAYVLYTLMADWSKFNYM